MRDHLLHYASPTASSKTATCSQERHARTPHEIAGQTRSRAFVPQVVSLCTMACDVLRQIGGVGSVPEGAGMSLDQFIEANHVELLSLTRGKAAKRNGPAGFPAIETEHGVPLFLSQLREALVEEAKQ